MQGQIFAAAGRRKAAFTAYEQSLALLATIDPFEAARTQVAWARDLLTAGRAAQAAERLDAAQPVFETLGAKRDLDEIQAIRRQP